MTSTDSSTSKEFLLVLVKATDAYFQVFISFWATTRKGLDAVVIKKLCCDAQVGIYNTAGANL